jgi:glutamine amidotransferase
MNRIHGLGLARVLDVEVIEKKKPLLGICLGMQLLASEGTEKGHCAGLGYVPGRVELLPVDLRLPHMGWNSVKIRKNTPLYSSELNNQDYYFIHSYAFVCSEDNHVAGVSEYGLEFVSMLNKDNIFGVQFHPEKSHRVGLKLLYRFLYLEHNPDSQQSGKAVEKVLKAAVSNDRKVHSWRSK